jgi:hypothetical protein
MTAITLNEFLNHKKEKEKQFPKTKQNQSNQPAKQTNK